MRKNIGEYFEVLKDVFDKIIVTSIDGKAYQLDEGIDIAIRTILDQEVSGGKLLFIGNGASASIASHMATDFWKSADIQALAFNDSSLLTCISNDYGYKHVFEKPIEAFGNAGDVLFAISSSGKSENIIRGVQMARFGKCHVITLSGFSKNNPLRSKGDINFYVPSSSYGHVEIIHPAICHCILDVILNKKLKNKEKVDN